MNPTLEFLEHKLNRFMDGDWSDPFRDYKDPFVEFALDDLQKLPHFEEFDGQDESRIPMKDPFREYNFKPSALMKYWDQKLAHGGSFSKLTFFKAYRIIWDAYVDFMQENYSSETLPERPTAVYN